MLWTEIVCASKQGVHGTDYTFNQQDMFTCEISDRVEFGTHSGEAGYMSDISKSVSFPHEPINPAAAIDVQQQHNVPHVEVDAMNSCSRTHGQNILQ